MWELLDQQMSDRGGDSRDKQLFLLVLKDIAVTAPVQTTCSAATGLIPFPMTPTWAFVAGTFPIPPYGVMTFR